MSANSDKETYQITTGEGEKNYTLFRQYFAENEEGDYGSQTTVILLGLFQWICIVIYLYYLLVGTQTGTDYVQTVDYLFLGAFAFIACYPVLQLFSRWQRLKTGEATQSRYTGGNNAMTPHCTKSLLEIDQKLVDQGIVGTVDFKCKHDMTKANMAIFDTYAQKSYYLLTALLMLIIYLLTQGKKANILQSDSLFLAAAVKISLIAGITVMVMSGFSVGTHKAVIIKVIPETAFLIQSATVYLIIAFILHRAVGQKAR